MLRRAWSALSASTPPSAGSGLLTAFKPNGRVSSCESWPACRLPAAADALAINGAQIFLAGGQARTVAAIAELDGSRTVLSHTQHVGAVICAGIVEGRRLVPADIVDPHLQCRLGAGLVLGAYEGKRCVFEGEALMGKARRAAAECLMHGFAVGGKRDVGVEFYAVTPVLVLQRGGEE